MNKTFGQLGAGDEVYIIKGCNVEIVKVERVDISLRRYVIFTAGYSKYTLPIDLSSYHHNDTGDIYCDIDDAIKTMKERCENALQNYKRASGALNKLEAKKK